MEKSILGERIASARKACGYSQEYVASKMSMIRQTYGAYERGVSVPDALVLSRLADLFGVTTDYLLGRCEASDVNVMPTNEAETVAAHPSREFEMTPAIEARLQEIVREAIEKYGGKKVGEV